MTERTKDRQRLERAVRRVRRRWRLRGVLRGLSVVGGGALAALLITGFGLDLLHFSAGAVTAFRIGAYALVGLLAIRFLAPPLLRSIPDDRVALYLEEHEPSLDAAVLTAVDHGPDGASDGLLRRLARDAAARLRSVEEGARVDRGALYRYTGVLVALALVGLVLGLAGPATLRTGAAALLFPARDAGELNPYAVEVLPGDTTVARGSDLRISARLVGFESGQVELMTAPAEGGDFEPATMLASQDRSFEFLLLDVNEPRRYYVRSAGVRSATFRVEVADLPYVDRMELVYHFPAYTGLEPRTVEDGGDVAVLPGTRVEFRATPTVSTPDGRLVLDDSATVELAPAADGRLTGSVTVSEPGGYRVELRRPDGALGAASPHYRIDVLEDQPPSVRFQEPGRDTEATPIEEIFVEAAADDDYGVGALDLVYSVNGADQDTLALYREEGAPLTEVSAGHTFFLEEWELVPGDVVSYYAVARDNDRVGGAREVVSDIYFVGIRPFRKNFSAADSRGAPGGGAGQGPDQGTLVEIQRQIVSATFNLVRDRETKDAEAWNADVVSVTLSQERLRGQVADLVARLQSRLSNAQEEAFRTVARELPRALEAMDSATVDLEERRAREALAPEQKALLHLQRADEAYRDVRVSLQNQAGAGGAGGQGSPQAEDLADLFELEMDKLRDQYETVQRGQRRQTNTELDETLERLKELARRQQQEAERRQRRLEAQGGGAAGGGDQQRALAEETEEAARRLERLARERGAPELEETARRLREAAESMRRSAAGGGGAGTADAREAAERLDEARRRMEEARSGRFQEDVEDALARARRLREDQGEMVDEVRRRAREGEHLDSEASRRLSERKDAMAGALEGLEDRLDRAAARARGEGTEGAADLQEAATGIRDDKLKEKVRFSRGLAETGDLERIVPFEEQIADDLERLTQRLEEARDAVAAAREPDPLEEALDRAQRLGRSMETLDRRLSGPADVGREGGEEAGGAGAPGVPGEGRRRAGETRPGPDGPPAFGPERTRQLRREFRRRAVEAEELGRRLQEAGRGDSEVDRVVEALRALDETRVYDDPEEVARLQEAALEGIQRLEFALRREIEARAGPPLRLPGADQVPESFRSLVEEYFRSLSEDAPDPGGR